MEDKNKTNEIKAKGSPKKRSRWWLCLELPLLLLVLLLLAIILIRLFILTDSRLGQLGGQFLSEQLGTEVSIGGVNLRLPPRLDIHDVQVAAPAGFTKPVLQIGQVALALNPDHLLDKRLDITKLSIADLAVNIEINDGGSLAITELLAPFISADSSSDDSVFTLPDLPKLPLAITIHDLSLENWQAALFSPNLQAEIGLINLHGRASLAAGELSAALNLTICRGGEEPGKVSWHYLDPDQIEVAGKAALEADLAIASSGLNSHKIDLDLNFTPELNKPLAISSNKLQIKFHGDTDLSQQTANLENITIRLGTEQIIQTDISLTNLFTGITMAAATTDIHLPLTEVGQLLGTFLPKASGSGTIDLRLDPVRLTLQNIDYLQLPLIQVTTNEATFKLPRYGLILAHLTMAADINPDQKKMIISASLAEFHLSTLHLNDLKLKLSLYLPWQDLWQLVPGTDPTQVQGFVNLASGNIDDLSLKQLTANFSGQLSPEAIATIATKFLPFKIWDKSPNWPRSPQAIKGSINLKLGQGKLGQQIMVNQLQVSGSGYVSNYLARTGQVKLKAQSPHFVFRGETTGEVSTPFNVSTSVQRIGFDDFLIKDLALIINDIIAVDLSGKILDSFSKKPELADFDVKIKTANLEHAWDFFPKTLRPGTEDWHWRGQLEMAIQAAGVIPYNVLWRLSQFAGQLDNGLPRLQPLFNFIDHGLPFWAKMQLKGENLTLSTPQLRLLDGSIKMDLTTGPDNKEPTIDNHLTFKELALADNSLTIGNSQVTAHLIQHLNDIKALVDIKAESISQNDYLDKPLNNVTSKVDLSFLYGGDVNFTIVADLPSLGAKSSATIGITKPHLVLYTKAWTKPHLPGLNLTGKMALNLNNRQAISLWHDSISYQGQADFDLDFSVHRGQAKVQLLSKLKNFSGSIPELLEISDVSGNLPIQMQLSFEDGKNRLVLVKNIPLGGGVIALALSEENILQRGLRPLYYDQIRPYRQQSGLSIAEVKAAGVTINDVSADLAVSNGIFSVDHLSFSAVGGDFNGTLGAQLTSNKAIRLDMGLNFTGVDASVLLNMPRSPDSEINGNLSIALEKSEYSRNLNSTINVTKLGRTTLDRFLQTLDPSGQNKSLLSARKNLKLVTIKGLNLWVKYENLKMYLEYQTKIGIPGTPIAYNPIKPEILGEAYSLSEYLDLYMDPLFQQYLGPILGWDSSRSRGK